MDSLIHRYWSTTYIQTFHPFCQIISENKETYQENASSQKQGTKENWLVENHIYTYMYSNLQNIYISQREPLIQAYYIAHHVPRKRREGWIKNHRIFFFLVHLNFLLDLALGCLRVHGGEIAYDLVDALAARAAHKARKLTNQTVRHWLGLALRTRARTAAPRLTEATFNLKGE